MSEPAANLERANYGIDAPYVVLRFFLMGALGDARALPFADNSFDAVVSSWALHNIYDTEERAQAIREIVRVLKPGGRVALIEIQHTKEYAQIFRESGMENVLTRGPNFVFVILSYSLTATKA